MAAKKAGLEIQTPEAVSADATARAIRDDLWVQYERVLRDEKTYTVTGLVQWLLEIGVKCPRTNVHRDRDAIRAEERRVVMAGEKARQTMALFDQAGTSDFLAAGRGVASQLMFEALTQLSPDMLSEMKPIQIIKLIDTFGKFSKNKSEEDLLKAHTAELQQKLDEKKRIADAQAAKLLESKGCKPNIVNQIREIYGLPKLEELSKP